MNKNTIQWLNAVIYMMIYCQTKCHKCGSPLCSRNGLDLSGSSDARLFVGSLVMELSLAGCWLEGLSGSHSHVTMAR